MKIIINTETLKKDYVELNKILYELRTYTKFWNDNYGHKNRLNKEAAEAKADEWIKNNLVEN